MITANEARRITFDFSQNNKEFNALLENAENAIREAANQGYKHVGLTVRSQYYPNFEREMENRGFSLINNNHISNVTYQIYIQW